MDFEDENIKAEFVTNVVKDSLDTTLSKKIKSDGCRENCYDLLMTLIGIFIRIDTAISPIGLVMRDTKFAQTILVDFFVLLYFFEFLVLVDSLRTILRIRRRFES